MEIKMENIKKQSKKKVNSGHTKVGKITEGKQIGMTKRDLVIITLIMLATLMIILGINSMPYNRFSTGMTGAVVNYEIGRTTEITSEILNASDYNKDIMTGSQTMQVKIITGNHKGEIVTASNALSTYNSVVMKAGKYVIVEFDELDSGEFQVRVFNYFRAPFIVLIGLLFLVSLIFVGGKKGLLSGLGLVYTFVCVLHIFLPLILRGYSPIFSAIILVLMVTSTTMVLLNGVTRKSLCAILGTISGVVLSGLILFVFGHFMHISGYSTNDAESLLLIGETTGLKVKDLLFSGILIASLGAIMDVAISIVSVIHEVHENMPGIHAGGLIRFGMNVGKDMIGSMANTLILAFTGTSLSLIILLYSYSVQFNQLMNMNSIAIEITQALAGSLGIVLTVPITAFITANVYAKRK